MVCCIASAYLCIALYACGYGLLFTVDLTHGNIVALAEKIHIRFAALVSVVCIRCFALFVALFSCLSCCSRFSVGC